jgi:hypothetical protein
VKLVNVDNPHTTSLKNIRYNCINPIFGYG